MDRVSESLGLPVWIKREDLLAMGSPGGSKVRKLRAILASARARAATDLVTIGTTGSHHVHATCVLGNAAGFRVHAVLLPQPDLPYARTVHEKTMAAGGELIYASGNTRAMMLLAGLSRRLKHQGAKPFFIFPGGTGADGVSAYRDAGLELKENLELLRKKGPVPDLQVCVYGTGGMAAGLHAAGTADNSLPAVYAVQVYPGIWNGKFYIRNLARLARESGHSLKDDCASSGQAAPALGGECRLETPSSYIDAGYGTESVRCREAVSLFEKDGIFLDPVYMARAGQAVIDLSRREKRPKGLLLWYTSPGRL